MTVIQLTQGFPATVVNAATTTGVAKSSPFAIQMRAPGLQRTVAFHCSGTYTVATLTLLESTDGGDNFSAVGAPMDFFADLNGNLASLNGLVAFTPGVIYKLSVTSITGTSITVKLTVP